MDRGNGDYADRGTNDVRNLEMVLDLKVRYPQNVVLMRGNHEEYVSLFNKLPVVLVTGNGLVAVHGGIPTEEVVNLQFSSSRVWSERSK
ncbi:hypothetical protein COT44_02325 [Candidatus Shapirobacteria bacterium CG08_land_8_20_14_0_20_39_18]|uniref:Serine/threonine specific protein phosphatases domain-containing protein n=1 Tax=Candidatus Shapirobacteria bacterium CG08_land_8_20_14_0_20_39_18 TaxID=1974883 RepID=A0A2M6XD57_9BACT|nr:MAG: hypothetical protein COT44_02325 [Candidatus Shapirobacteria bacterium CG08_land_8_20_14_0_20_39_18]PIY66144.1 MAG: hypothetical protein COY91_01595 [Candidatus Shapirobacteria bacterium CG_4_10_14_0_8_um_filter_39_15]PJE68847.1 MAG: hypothetical protein COU94_00065 [Candidatus Shapirobacteria bacterium CG10_big_fil_rev_8_21_14_0_10_38_8]